MPKFLSKVSYTAEGLQGLLQDGGSKRREVGEKLAESVGATIEGFYYAFGDSDVYAIFDAPDNATAASLAMTMGATGAVGAQTIALLTPEEIDEAVQKSPSYTPPGD